MPITINGSGTVTGISAGGLPDDCITTAEIAANAVTAAKLGSNEASGLCKAWVNFNGTGTVAIQSSYNVSSVTDGGVGMYTVNLATALLDQNYSILAMSNGLSNDTTTYTYAIWGSSSSSSVQIRCAKAGTAALEDKSMSVAIFR
jgi:hypothetical protein